MHSSIVSGDLHLHQRLAFFVWACIGTHVLYLIVTLVETNINTTITKLDDVAHSCHYYPRFRQHSRL